MTQDALDARLSALLTEPEPAADPAFAERIVALAAHDLAVRRWRRRALARVGREAAGLAAVLAAFAALAGLGEAAGLGDLVPLGSPAMLGLAMLGLWGLVALRGDNGVSLETALR